MDPSDVGTTDIPLEFFPAPSTASGGTAKKKDPKPTKLHGVLTIPTSLPPTGEKDDIVVLLLHGAGGDLHSGHLVWGGGSRAHLHGV